MKKLCLLAAAFSLTVIQIVHAQTKRMTCDGILVEVDMIPGADFPMAVVYDNTDTRTFQTHTCVLDLSRAGHWPLRGACWLGERCGPYFKKIGNTYYMRTWDKAEAPGHSTIEVPSGK
jgi:hypothetical protein